MIPLLINKEKLKTIKGQIQNKFAELDFRDEDDTLDHVLAALQEISEELAANKYGDKFENKIKRLKTEELVSMVKILLGDNDARL